MKSIKYSLILGSTLFGLIQTQAQEITATLNGGFQGLDYSVKNGDNSIKLGGKVGIGYTYFLNKNWGIITGAEFGFFKNSSSIIDGTYSTYQIDSDSDAFQYKVQTTNYKEKSNFYSISIPLMMQYHTTGNTQFYINGGGRVFLPFSYKVKGTADQINMTGYYSDVNLELTDLPRHGFSNLSDWKNTNKNSIKTTIALSAETGVSFKLTDAIRLYTGLYIDYGLNDVQKKNNSLEEIALVNYDSEGTRNIKPNGVLKADSFTDKAKLLTYGIQVKVGFGKKNYKDEPIVIEEVIIPIEEVIVEEPMVETIVTQITEPSSTINDEQIKIVEEYILFKTLGNTTLSEENKLQLNEISNILKKYPEQKLEIQGYSCSIGTEDRNIRARLKRAEVVAEYLETKGIKSQQLEIKPVIEVEPLFPNNNEKNRQKNRRAVIKVVK